MTETVAKKGVRRLTSAYCAVRRRRTSWAFSAPCGEPAVCGIMEGGRVTPACAACFDRQRCPGGLPWSVFDMILRRERGAGDVAQG